MRPPSSSRPVSPPRRVLGFLLAGLLALLVGGGAVGSAPAAAATGPKVTRAATTAAAQNRVSDYWTPARMRQATPAVEPGTPDRSAVQRGTPARVADAPATNAAAATITTTTGKVFFTLGGTDFVCSGSATSSTNHDVVSSAGHCVNEGPGAFATNWAFVPAYNNGSAPFGVWTARTLVTTSQWANSGDINFDTGFAVMNTLNASHLTDVVGGQGVAFNLARGLSYQAFGYPAAPPFDGETLQSCAGTAFDDTFGGTQSQGIPCNMTGGSSGGPWFTGGLQNSINSFGYNGVPNVMFGPYWGSVIQGAYNTASVS
jgi:hypothetical protein